MPTEYRIDQARGLVLSRGWGVVTPQEFAEHGLQLRADPDFRPGHRQLWDLTELTSTPSTFSDLTDLAKLTVFAPQSRRAILAPIDVAFGLARMFQMLREAKGETGIRVFRDQVDALRWLETGEESALPTWVDSRNPLKNPPPPGLSGRSGHPLQNNSGA